MNKNHFYTIISNKYDITNKDNINILSVKKNHLYLNKSIKNDNIILKSEDKLKVNQSDYKIIIKFTKDTYIVFRTGISMNLKKIKCKIGLNEFEINTIFAIKMKVFPNDIIELETELIKKYFEIFIKIDEINDLDNIGQIININNKLNLITNKNLKLIDTHSDTISDVSYISDVSDVSDLSNNINNSLSNNMNNSSSNKTSDNISDNTNNTENKNKCMTKTTKEILLLSNIESKQKIKKVIIVLSKFIKSIGENFKLIFESRGLDCEIVYSFSLLDCLESTPEQMYLIVYNEQTHNLLPLRFIYYQVEQVNSVFLSDPKLLKRIIYMMTKAEKVWEYTSNTRQIYSKYCMEKLKWIPMPYYYINNVQQISFDSCEYDLFFYGHPNIRRNNILNILSKYFDIKIGFGCYEEKKIKYIKKSKIILNLHFYKNSGLETCRINEILNYNKLIISESSSTDLSNMQLYSDYVVFVDEIDDKLSNIKKLIKTIKYYLDRTNYQSKINYDKKKLSDYINKLICF